MTVINRQPLKISDPNRTVLSVHDDKDQPGEPITIGVDVHVNGVRVSVGVELSRNDASALHDQLGRLIRERISRTAARSVPVT